jgi:GAF domain-containing protein
MASAAPPDISTTLAQVAQDMNATLDLDTSLSTIVHVAAKSLPDIDHVGITIAHRDGRMETKAASDEFVRRLDELQYDVGEGPCVYAMDAHPVVRVEHAASEQRWPKFIPAAVQQGLRAQLGLQLYLEDQTLGALNMYSTSSDTVCDETAHFAEIFATHAALALGHARREDQLNNAIRSRQLIGQATGILMERYALNAERAFDYLIRVSSHSNTKLRDVAQQLVDRSSERYQTASSQ